MRDQGMSGIADVFYDAYNRRDAAAVAKLCDADRTHEDIAMGHSKVGLRPRLRMAWRSFSVGFRMPTGPRTCGLQIHSDR